jgi:formate dehydrogenase major subunit
VGNFTLGVSQRGARTRLVADGGLPHGESSCVACGTCVQVCPTGALYERRAAYQGYGPAAQATASICVGCSLGCGLQAVVRDGRLVRVDGDWASPVSGGLLCRAGRFAPVADPRERLLAPLLRRDGRLAPASWDEALHAAAAGLPGAAGLISTRLPVESLAAFRHLLVDGLHSRLVTSIEEGRTAAGLDGEGHEAGLAALHAADLVIVWGVELGRSHQVAGFFIKRRLPAGLKLVVIDPCPTALDTRAEHVLRPARGADAQLLQAWLAALAPDAVEAEVGALAEQAGVAGEDLVALVRAVARAERPVIVYGKGLTADQPEAVGRLQALARVSGHLRLLPVRGGANSRAAEALRLDRRFWPAAGAPVFIDLGDDDASARLLAAVQPAPFVVVAASYRSPLTDRADVVLPVATWVEQAGHYLNLEGRLQAAHAALPVPDGARANEAVLNDLAERVGLALDGDWRAALPQPVAAGAA